MALNGDCVAVQKKVVAPSISILQLTGVDGLAREADLLFLGLSFMTGMPVVEVAGFLARNEDEVREKSVELRREGCMKSTARVPPR
jgi:hypothetical protein